MLLDDLLPKQNNSLSKNQLPSQMLIKQSTVKFNTIPESKKIKSKSIRPALRYNKKYSKSDLRKAIELVIEGNLTINDATLLFNVPQKTLRKYIDKNNIKPPKTNEKSCKNAKNCISKNTNCHTIPNALLKPNTPAAFDIVKGNEKFVYFLFI